MKILIVTQYFWPENFRINDLAYGLLERGYHVTVLSGIPNYPEGKYFSGYGCFKKVRQDHNGVKIIRVPLVPRRKGGIFHLILNYLSFALCASVLAPVVCRENYDLIFVYEPSPVTVGLPALFLKKIKRSPILFWVQDIWPESLSATGAIHSKGILKIVESLVRFIYSGCDRILVQSRAFSPSIERLGVDSDRIVYFPNSAEELYQPVIVESDAPERQDIPSGFCIMFAGNIGAAQDFAAILDAAQQLKDYTDIHWVIIGDGRKRSWVEAEVKGRGLDETVHLLGKHSVQSMPRYFSLSDVLLVTLKREPIFALTIPSKVQSYLACAKPVIAALAGEGARVIKEAGAGIVCTPEDPKSLADAVLAMYRKPEIERHSMGLCGRDYFEKHFERTMLLDRLNGWINELCKEAGQCES